MIYLFFNTQTKQVLTKGLTWAPVSNVATTDVLWSKMNADKLVGIVKWFPSTQFHRLDRFRKAHPATSLPPTVSNNVHLVENELGKGHLPPALQRFPASKLEIDIFQSIIQNGMEGAATEISQWVTSDNYSIVCKLFGLEEYSKNSEKGGTPQVEVSTPARETSTPSNVSVETSDGTVDIEENDIPIKPGESIPVTISEDALDDAMLSQSTPVQSGEKMTISNVVGLPATQSALTASMIEYIDGINNILSTLDQLEIQKKNEVREMDAMQQDLLHLVEFVNLNAADTYNVYKKLQEVRTKRREAKNDLCAIEMVKKLGERTDLRMLDTVSHHLHAMDYRLYTARVMTEADLDSLISNKSSREKVRAKPSQKEVS